MLVSGLTHIGHVRGRNEDRIGWNSEAGVAMVADGVGGQPAGDVASRLAVETVLSHVERQPGNWLDGGGDPRSLIQLAHHALRTHMDREPATRGMATTLMLACVGERHIRIVHAGDCRAYRLHEGALARLSKDQTFAQHAVDHQLLTEDEARQSPQRHRLTQALGMDDTPKPEVIDLPRQEGDLLLLCSDGMTGEVSDATLESLLNEYAADLDAAARALVHAALDAGGRDNVSAVLLRV